jgi:hypothetical protein
MKNLIIASVLLTGSFDVSSAGVMPGYEPGKFHPPFVQVDYTCGEGRHFTNQGCVADRKPPQQPARRKPSRHIRKVHPKRHQ